MPTLLLSPRRSEDSDAMEHAAISAGWKVHRPDGWRVGQEMGTNQVLAFYGEALFVRVIADQTRYLLLEASHDWLASLPEHYLLRQVKAMTLAEAYEIQEPAFIKPAGDKAFISKVYASGAELAEATQDLAGTVHVLVSEFAKWQIECRSFVLNGEVQSLATYIYNGQIARAETGTWLHYPEIEYEAELFVSRLLKAPEVSYPPAFVLDVGIIEGRGWAVLEANPAWASGIYGNKPDRVLPVIERSCIHPDRLTSDDHGWISEWESWEPE